MIYWLLSLSCLAILWKVTGEFKLAALYLVYFALGVMVNTFRKESWLCNKAAAAISFLAVCLATCFWTSGATSAMNILLKIVVSMAMIQLTYILCTESFWHSWIDRFVQRCGVYSIAIYILHWTFLSIRPYHPMLPQNELIGLIATLTFAIIISYLCCAIYGYIRRIPLVLFFLFGQRR